MKHYSPKQINEIKQEIRKGKPVAIIADELATRWERPVRGVYSKVLKLSKQTRKITNEYDGPKRKPYAKRAPKATVASNIQIWGWNEKEQTVVKEICEEIVSKPIERQPAEIGIEVPVGVVSFTGVPSRIMVYPDHVRYYFDN